MLPQAAACLSPPPQMFGALGGFRVEGSALLGILSSVCGVNLLTAGQV